MKGEFNPKKGEISLWFEPVVDSDSIFIFKLVLYEQWEQGVDVPDFDAAFLEKLASCGRKRRVVLDHRFLDFAVAFLDDVFQYLTENKADTTELDDLLCAVDEWRLGEGWYLGEKYSGGSYTLQ